MFQKHYCDCCNRCIATHKVWTITSYNISQEVDLCGGCIEILEQDEIRTIGEFTLIKDKIEFLRNMPPTLEERLEKLEYQTKTLKKENEELQNYIDELQEW